MNGSVSRRCMVLGCGREGTFVATRERRTKVGVIAVTLWYCGDHYGQANRFQQQRRAAR